MLACATLISTNLPRESTRSPNRKGTVKGHILGDFFGEQPHANNCTADSAERKIARVTNKMVSKVSSRSLCSLIWLLLFTSNSDAVHPTAVYRSFHQNDHFTVPLPNSTLSAQCKAAYDKLMNPNSSDVTELVACKFVKSTWFFVRDQR